MRTRPSTPAVPILVGLLTCLLNCSLSRLFFISSSLKETLLELPFDCETGEAQDQGVGRRQKLQQTGVRLFSDSKEFLQDDVDDPERRGGPVDKKRRKPDLLAHRNKVTEYLGHERERMRRLGEERERREAWRDFLIDVAKSVRGMQI